jgi:hypothetical protein
MSTTHGAADRISKYLQMFVHRPVEEKPYPFHWGSSMEAKSLVSLSHPAIFKAVALIKETSP